LHFISDAVGKGSISVDNGSAASASGYDEDVDDEDVDDQDVVDADDSEQDDDISEEEKKKLIELLSHEGKPEWKEAIMEAVGLADNSN